MATIKNNTMNLQHFEAIITLLNLKDKFGRIIMQDGKKVVKTFSGKIFTHLYYDGQYMEPDDKIYHIHYHDCGGKCSIGNPAKKCVENKNYASKSCAVVNVSAMKEDHKFEITLDQISQLIDQK